MNLVQRGALAGGKNTLFVCSVETALGGDSGNISCEKNVWTNNHASAAKLALGYSL